MGNAHATTQYSRARKRRKTWKKVMGVLASVVVFCTTYALILPAITAETPVFCGCEEKHGSDCYDPEGNLTCEKEVHEHTLQCFSDPSADTETREEWEKTLDRLDLTGDETKDLVTIAESQLGYAESIRNYRVSGDGETMKGYTRFGVWMEDPYADWGTAFAAFCMEYAGIDEKMLPDDADPNAWLTKLKDQGVTVLDPKAGDTPAEGCLVFLKQDKSGDGADTVGILVGLEEAGVPTYKIILGDSHDKVEKVALDPEDSRIAAIVQITGGSVEDSLQTTAETDDAEQDSETEAVDAKSEAEAETEGAASDNTGMPAKMAAPRLMMASAATKDLYLQAAFSPRVPDGTTQIAAVVKATVGGTVQYLKCTDPATNSYTFVSDQKDATVYYPAKADGWAVKLEGIPDGYSYEVEQLTRITNYKTNYSTGTYAYNTATVHLTVTPSETIADKYLQVLYNANGQSYTCTLPTKVSMIQGVRNSTPYTFTISEAVRPDTSVRIQSVYIAKPENGGYVKDTAATTTFSFSWKTDYVPDSSTAKESLIITNTEEYGQVIDPPDTTNANAMNLDKTVRPYIDPTTNEPVENEFIVTLKLDIVDTFTQYLAASKYTMVAQNNYKKYGLGTIQNQPSSQIKQCTTDYTEAKNNGWESRWVGMTVYDYNPNNPGARGELLAENLIVYFENANNTTLVLNLLDNVPNQGDKKCIVFGHDLTINTGMNEVILTQQASEVVHNLVEGTSLSITDFMGGGVEFLGPVLDGTETTGSDQKVTYDLVNGDKVVWDPVTKSLSWEPAGNTDQPYEEDRSDGYHIRWYEGYALLEYRVRLKTEASGFDSSGDHLNGNYAATEEYAVNLRAYAEYGEEKVDFPIPIVRGVLYNIELKKTDSKTGKPIAGVKFKINTNPGMEAAITTGKDSNGNYIVTTDANGIAKFENLVGKDGKFDGVFYFTEMESPEGYYSPDLTKTTFTRPTGLEDAIAMVSIGNYTSDETKDHFQVDGENMLYLDPTGVLNIKNEPCNKLQIQKLDVASFSPLAGAEFDLYFADETTPKYHLISGADGILTVENSSPVKNTFDLALGEWTLTETKPPDGYLLPTGSITIQVDRDKIRSSGSMSSCSYVANAKVYLLRVSNSSGYELPHTGGIGLPLLYAFASFLLAFVIVTRRTKRRGEKGAG